jgi:Mrp family chromosome partitioning ATPase/capsular polysaccharide biosynthesis protein
MQLVHYAAPESGTRRLLEHSDNGWKSEGPGLLRSLWRYRLLIVLVTAAMAAGGHLIAQQQPPTYESEVRLLLRDPRTSGLYGELRPGVSDAGRFIRNQAELIQTGPIYAMAVEEIDGRLDREDLETQVTIEVADVDVDLIVIVAQDDSPEGAHELAAAVASAYQTFITDQVQTQANEAIAELEARNTALRQEIRRLDTVDPSLGVESAAVVAERNAAISQLINNEGRIEQLTVDASLFGSGVDAIGQGRMPDGPVAPRPILWAVGFGLLGLLLSAELARRRSQADRELDDAGDAAAVLGAPLLGEIPEFSRVGVSGSLPMVEAPMSPASEAYQFVMASLGVLLKELQGNVLLVTSATPNDGKTVTSANLAIAARRSGSRVVLADIDRRMRGLSQLFDVDDEYGLVSLQSEGVPFEWGAKRLDYGPDLDLTFVTVGFEVTDPASYFRTPGFRRALRRMAGRGDLVILDAPPLLAVSETSAIASHADGIVVVVSRGTSQAALAETARRLEFIGTPVLGFVFNRARPRGSAYGYLRGDYYRSDLSSAAAADDDGDEVTSASRQSLG